MSSMVRTATVFRGAFQEEPPSQKAQVHKEGPAQQP